MDIQVYAVAITAVSPVDVEISAVAEMGYTCPSISRKGNLPHSPAVMSQKSHVYLLDRISDDHGDGVASRLFRGKVG